MTAYYPVMLDLSGRRCVVVGGGAVAERKTRALLEAGADVEVVSPQLSEGLRELAAGGVIRLTNREYRVQDLEGASLVFAATDSRTVNEQIVCDARNAGRWVNVADRYDEGDFVTPSVVRRGDLVMAVTTSGGSPALAARIAERLSEQYGPSYGEFIAWLRRLRELGGKAIPDEKLRRQALRNAIDVEEHEWRQDTDESKLEARLRSLIDERDGG